MTDSQWFDDWMKAWQAFPAAPGNPWTAALEHFSRSSRSAPQAQLGDAMAKITEQSRAFFELGQQLSGRDGEDWQRTVFKYLEVLSEQIKDPQASARAFAGSSPLDYWQQFAGHAAGERPSFLSQLEQTLQTPGLGYTREHQEAAQVLSRRWLAYEKAYGEYAAYCAETSRRSVERLRARLEEEFGNKDGPETIRQLYDEWIACCEEVYAERAATQEYVKLHGGMVNTLMAYKQQAARITDQWADAMNLPTREEVDALHRKLKDMRGELRQIRMELEASGPVRPAGGSRKRRAK